MTLGAQHAGKPTTQDAAGGGLYHPPDRALLSSSAPEVARLMLGMLLVRDEGRGVRMVRIVETEAYAGPEDRASHARAGRTARTAVMFGPPGHAYVYLVYGLHHCLNVVCGPDHEAAAVLVRAAEPLEGLAAMRLARGSTAGPDARLAAGPARLCQALDIDRSLDGVDLLGGPRLRLVADSAHPGLDERVVAGPRIGVAYAGGGWADRLWRFGIAGHPSLSRPFPPGNGGAPAAG